MTDTPQILLAHHLKALKLPTFLREYDKVARLCAAEGADHPLYLMRLAEMEMIDRERRMVERRIKAAKFPTVKSLDSFDFLALPSLNKMAVLELARSEYVGRRENIIAVGNSAISRWGSAWRPARRVYRLASPLQPLWFTSFWRPAMKSACYVCNANWPATSS